MLNHTFSEIYFTVFPKIPNYMIFRKWLSAMACLCFKHTKGVKYGKTDEYETAGWLPWNLRINNCSIPAERYWTKICEDWSSSQIPTGRCRPLGSQKPGCNSVILFTGYSFFVGIVVCKENNKKKVKTMIKSKKRIPGSIRKRGNRLWGRRCNLQSPGHQRWRWKRCILLVWIGVDRKETSYITM